MSWTAHTDLRGICAPAGVHSRGKEHLVGGGAHPETDLPRRVEGVPAVMQLSGGWLVRWLVGWLVGVSQEARLRRVREAVGGS